MNNQKLGTLLNLALDATSKEREESMELNVGYDKKDDQWTLIINYTGDYRKLQSPDIRIVPLLGGYAVVKLPQGKIREFTMKEQVLYVEKPKSLYFSMDTGRGVSCLNSIQNQGLKLKGRGVIVGCVDSGVDFTHPDFTNTDGTTRILYLWDQTLEGKPPEGYTMGREFTEEEINRALQAENPMEREKLVPSRDVSGHGTAVLGIAAGNGRESAGIYRGVAPESRLIVVKMAVPSKKSFPRTTELIQGVDYIVKKSAALSKPLALNLSFGSSYGSHSGNSLTASYMNVAARTGKTCICAGMGNEGNKAGHFSGVVKQGRDTVVELGAGAFLPALNVQLWKNYQDEMEIYMVHPSGRKIGPLEQFPEASRINIENTQLLIYYGQPSPYTQAQEIYIDFLPKKDYVDSGVWKFVLSPKRIVEGDFDMWLPGGKTLGEATFFYRPVPERTITIPATAQNVISVGAYDGQLQSYADFSGRGYTRVTDRIKPDLAAPGVDITTVKAGGGYGSVTGTSFATPFVTGAAALLMEWGIINGNDSYLYGEKVKSYLIRGARQIPGEKTYPNPRIGYGVLCVADSIPGAGK